MPNTDRQFTALLETPELAALGPGPRRGRKSLTELNKALEANFRSAKASTQQQTLIRALVLLWHDHLDESHSLAQDIPTPDGSFIHGIMHRREPDYGNAKYWFQRVGPHAAFAEIARKVAEIPASPAERNLLSGFNRNGTWDPFAFIDCCQEQAKSASDAELILRKVQEAEFFALLAHIGSTP